MINNKKSIYMRNRRKKKIIKFVIKLIFICFVLSIIFIIGKKIYDKKVLDISDNVEKRSVNNEEIKVVPESNESEVNKYSDNEYANIKLDEKNVESMQVLVNKQNPMDKDYIPKDLVIPNVNLVAKKSDERNLMRREAAKAIEEMFKDAEKDGYILHISSAYRSYKTQSEIYNSGLCKNGQESTKYIAVPGESEHQTGLAADITSRKMKFKLDENFEDTKEGTWLLNNSYRYGFILRYPKGKEAITGYAYEPWHYRYVGKEISQIIHRKGLTLEEFYKQVRENNKK